MAKELSNEDIGRPIDYDPDFRGPRINRSCTDVIFLFVFLAFVVGWAVIGVWAIKNGDPETLLAPRDSLGLRCGIDEEVKELKYLFFFDLTKCLDPSTPFLGCQTPQVCVSKCPDEVFYYSTTANTSKALPYCRYDYRSGTYDPDNCPAWFLPSENLFNRCVYNVADRKRSRWKIASIEGDEINLLKKNLNAAHLWLSLTIHNGITIVKDHQDVHKSRCIPSMSLVNSTELDEIASIMGNQTSDSLFSALVGAINNIKLLTQVEQIAEQVIADVISSWWKILIGVSLALVACIIYILMLRWIAGIMVWISIAGALAALSAATYFSCITWRSWKSTYETDGLAASKTKRDIFLGIFIVVVIVLSIVLLMLIFLRKRIVLAIALIKEGSKAVSSVTSVLFFPILPWILQLGVVAYAICVGVFLATTGEPMYQYRNLTQSCREETGWTVETECFPNNFSLAGTTSCSGATCKFAKIANEAYYPYLQTYNVFGFFWLAFFVSALGQMVLAQVFAQWYWTMKKRTLPFFALTAAFYRTVRYHLGTLAFGSLIIAICRMIRVCLEYIDHKLKKYDNEVTKAIMCCLKCFFWCLEKFLKFINKNAYIMCAIHGKNFCASAKDAFMLLLRNIVRVFVLDKVTDFVFFLSKLLVTAGVGAVAYLFFATDLISFMDNSQLNYGVVPVIMIMIVTYLVSALFFSVYTMAVDTLFLCFLEDCERNDGKTRPYYMSRNLMKIFGKKNKGPKID